MKVELVPVVSTLGHSPSTRLGVVASVGVLLWDCQTAQARTEARLSTGPALDDARAGGGPDEGLTGAR